MNKIAILIAGIFLTTNIAFAGGILTNTNQSAQFVRMLSRNASTDLDAVYFNPAGLTQMKNGFYFAFNNQTIFQNRTINSGFPFLNNADYKGEVFAPVFPSAFAVYKSDKWKSLMKYSSMKYRRYRYNISLHHSRNKDGY